LGWSTLRATRKVRSPGRVFHKHLYPQPRIAVGQWLADHRLATAAMDLSDGLSTDLARLCASSKVGALIDESKLAAAAVRHASVPKWNQKLSLALHGGDDYELIFPVASSQTNKIPPTYRGLKLTAIGEVTRGHKLELLAPDGKASTITPSGWDPFVEPSIEIAIAGAVRASTNRRF
jgi:thiamine-monophosphate kinase